MIPFTFQCATRIVFGADTEDRVGRELIAEGMDRVLLLYGGGSVRRSGLYDRVVASLAEAGVRFEELGGVRPNPRVSLVNRGVSILREKKLNGILAVGGGSVIDSAKCMAFAVYHDGDAWDFLTGKAKPGKECLPVATILTIPAAGSEASDSCVITREETLEKRGFGAPNMRPRFSILDPVLTTTLPPFQTACGVMDIMAHVMERYFTPTANVELTDRLAEGILQTLLHNGPRALADPTDLAARSEILWCGTLGQNDMTGTGRAQDWANHVMEHAISALYDVAHGAGLAVTYLAWMRYYAPRVPTRFAQLAVRVFGEEMDFEAPERTAQACVRRFAAFTRAMGLPHTFAELGVPEPDIERMLDIVFPAGDGEVGAFSKLRREDMREILRLATEDADA